MVHTWYICAIFNFRIQNFYWRLCVVDATSKRFKVNIYNAKEENHVDEDFKDTQLEDLKNKSFCYYLIMC